MSLEGVRTYGPQASLPHRRSCPATEMCMRAFELPACTRDRSSESPYPRTDNAMTGFATMKVVTKRNVTKCNEMKSAELSGRAA